MARYDEQPTLGTEALCFAAVCAAFFGAMYLAEWVGSLAGSLIISAIVGFAVPATISFIPSLFGMGIFAAEDDNPTTVLGKIWFLIRWLIVPVVLALIVFKFREEFAAGLSYAGATKYGFFAGCFAVALCSIARSRIVAGRQSPQ
jgi:hypothetical protein